MLLFTPSSKIIARQLQDKLKLSSAQLCGFCCTKLLLVFLLWCESTPVELELEPFNPQCHILRDIKEHFGRIIINID